MNVRFKGTLETSRQLSSAAFEELLSPLIPLAAFFAVISYLNKEDRRGGRGAEYLKQKGWMTPSPSKPPVNQNNKDRIHPASGTARLMLLFFKKSRLGYHTEYLSC